MNFLIYNNLFLDYILDNYVLLFEIIGLFIILFISVHLSKEIKRRARIAIILLLVINIVHNVELYTHDYSNLYILRFFLTAFKYISYPILIITLLPIASPSRKKLPLKYKIILLLPELVSIPFYLTSQWTKLIAYFVPAGEVSLYMGGPLRLWPYFIFGIYFIVFVTYNIFYLKKYSYNDQRISLFITVAAFLGIILLVIFEKPDDFTPIFAAALLLYFIFLYIHIATLDPLTGLLNRQSYEQALSYKVYGAISIDMNELKYMNDKYGHEAGDNALKIISMVLQTFSTVGFRIYRIGGDEFMGLFFKPITEEEASVMISVMEDKMEVTGYSCAFGFALNENDSILDTLKRADDNMYNDKKIKKEKALSSGKECHFRD